MSYLTKIRLWFAVCAAFFTMASAAFGADPSLVIKLADGLAPADQSAVIARDGGTEISSIPALRLHIISVPANELPQVFQQYQADPQVVSVEQNKTRKAEGLPNDVNYGVQWGLSKIGWESVYGTLTPTGTATVALLDTGVDATHADLAGNLTAGTSILDGSNGLTDTNGHGTAMAGIVAALTGNSDGIAGVAYQGVRIMPVTVLNASGTGQDSDIISGIIYAADHGADVILMAFSNPDFSQNLQDAIDYAWSKGAVLVAATGNSGLSTATFPAGDRGVVGVSGTAEDDTLMPGSNTGLDVFLAAPGNNIYTTSPGNQYTFVTGTSASSAVVAGVAAFMKAVDPSLSNGVIVGRLAKSADAIGTAGAPDNQTLYGNGRVNMAGALTSTATDSIQPAGADPVGAGGPYVGAYSAAASAAANGDGTMTVTPTTAVGASTGNTFTFTFTGKSGRDFTSGSQATITVPSNWTAPSSGAGPGQVTVTNGTCTSASLASAASNVITVNMACVGNTTFTVSYSGVTPPSTAGSSTFAVKTKQNGGVLTAIASSPTVTITNVNQTIGAITFSPATLAVGGTTTASATATSRLPVSFSSQTTAVCTVNGSTVTAVTAGNCIIAADQAGDATYNAAPQVTQSLTVGKGTQSAVSVSAPATASYRQNGLVATASGGTGTGSFTFSAGSSTACSVNSTSGAITITSGTGTCAISATRLGDSNYNNSAASSAANITVSKVPLTVTPDSQTKVYGAADPALTYSASGFVNGENQSVLAGSLGRSAGENVSSYPINLGTLASTNYSFTLAGSALLGITPAPLTVTADAKTKSYGATDPALTYSYSALANGDTASVFTGSLTRAAGESVGSYAIQKGTLSAGSNYNLTYNGASFAITKANASVTPAAASKNYGATDPTLTGALSGFLAADNVVATYSRTAGENAGTYTISATLTPAAALNNYNITYNTANFTINKVNASVTPSAASKSYGAADPTLAGTLSGFIAADNVAATYSRTAGENAGTYTISATINPTAVLENYNITYNTAIFTVKPGVITVTAGNATRAYGAANPSFTASYSGFIGSDTVANSVTGAASLSTTAGPSSPAGNYPITAGQGNLSANNYTFSFVAGTLAVTKVDQNITFAALPQRALGEQPFALAATASSGLPVSFSVVSGPATISGNILTLTGTGTVTVKASQAGGDNYNGAADVPQSFNVTATIASPGWTYVAASNTTGNFGVSWGTSTTSNVTYVVQESTSSNFSTFTEIYVGSANQISLTNRANGTYYYRTKAVKSGCADSPWALTQNSIVVNATAGAPFWTYLTAANTTGNFMIAWGASATQGVTYVVQESTDPTFTSNFSEVYNGTANQVYLTNRVSATYYYRVRAVKSGYNPSPWTSAPNGMQVNAVVGAPFWTYLTSANTSGNYTVAWGESATQGVTFLVQESTDPTFPAAATAVVYTGTSTQVYLTNRVTGTYYYRVKATKTGYTDSPWTTAPNGISVNAVAGAPFWVYVAASNNTGSYSFTWGASATQGVSFVVEESVDPNFATFTEVYRGSGNAASVTGRSSGTTYYYRAKAVKTGYQDSPYTVSSNGIAVSM